MDNNNLNEEEKKAYKDYLINREILRNAYKTENGRYALLALLADLDFFDAGVETPEEVARQNAARLLLYKLGIWRKENAKRIVDALLNMPYTTKDEKDV